MTLSFPKDFMWGTATASHQVEGGNWNNDWWAWEHDPASGCAEPSGDACDQYHLFSEDISLLARLGFNSYRFSIEWSRIEPEDGEFSRAALGHYRRVLGACHDQGLTPVVTFHHFSTPRWLADQGGWISERISDRFTRFCDYAVKGLGDLIGMACTINEPNIVAHYGYLLGTFPPGLREPDGRQRATDNFIAAHRKSYDVIKAGVGSAPVGLTLSMADYLPVDGGEDALEEIRHISEDVYLEAVKGDDFLGVQTYSRELVGPEGPRGPEAGRETTLMGYEYCPAALEATIRRATKVADSIPIVVTENGIATADDSRRVVFVQSALEGVARCLADGIDVRGYFYWSALDNFEWALGYVPTFGLIAVDRATQERTPKPSAVWLGDVARNGSWASVAGRSVSDGRKVGL